MAGRNRNIDYKPDGVENDAEYKRLVRDIEDMQQRQGWLAGRGAFDKTDLLYLRDSELQQRHVELHQRERELSAFAALRARIEAEAGEVQASGSAPAGPGTGAAPRAQQQQPAKQPSLPQKRSLVKPLVPGVVIKPVSSRGAPAPGAALASPAKRPKVETLTTAKATKGPAGKAAAVDVAGKAAAGKASATAGSKPAAGATDRAGKGDAAALAGLLGGYGSEDESSSGSDHSDAQQQPPAGGGSGGGAASVPAAKLPNAAALLGDDADKHPKPVLGTSGSSPHRNGHDRGSDGSDSSSGSSEYEQDT